MTPQPRSNSTETRGDPDIAEPLLTDPSYPLADQKVVHLHFDSNPFAVGDAIETIVSRVSTDTPSEDTLSAIEIVVAEVINNIIEHAYRNRAGFPIEVIVSRNKTGWAFHFTDRGEPIPGGLLPAGRHPDLRVPTESLPEGGFGWLLIRELTQDLHYCNDGAENHLEFSVPWAESTPNQPVA